jgi:hypothetical protein
LARQTGDNEVLTFFEYLRQRAFESVLCGAQEALELLERQQNHSEPKAWKPRLPAPDVSTDGPAKPPWEKGEKADLLDDDPLLPAPRRRGRPESRAKELS